MVEFALVGPPFLFCLTFMLELGYDLYAQEMLDYGLQLAARELQTGNTQSITSTAKFISDCVCPAVSGLLDCNNIYINVQTVTDYYSEAPGGVPMTSGHINTSGFTFTPTTQSTFFLATAVYLSPSLVSAFVPAMALSTGSSFVRATFSSAAFVTENYTPNTPSCCQSINHQTTC